MAITSYFNAKQAGDDFIKLLSDKGISIPTGVKQEDDLLSLFQLLHSWDTTGSNTLINAELLRKAVGVLDLASLITSIEMYSDFDQLLPHLKLFEEAVDVDFGQNSQGTSSGASASNSNKIIELYIGALVILLEDKGARNVMLDDPTKSKGDNPDVMFDFGSKKWAIALKTIHSSNGQTIFENIKKGAEQIESCSADKGIIIINAKNKIDHTSLWNPQKPFIKVDDAIVALRKQLENLVANVNSNRDLSDWQNVFSGNKAIPPVLFMGHSLMAYHLENVGVVPMPVKMFLIEDFGCGACSEVRNLVFELNEWMQAPL